MVSMNTISHKWDGGIFVFVHCDLYIHASYAGCQYNPTTQHRGRNTKGLFTVTAIEATRSHLFSMRIGDLMPNKELTLKH